MLRCLCFLCTGSGVQCPPIEPIFTIGSTLQMTCLINNDIIMYLLCVCMYYQLQCFALAKYVMIFSNCLHE